MARITTADTPLAQLDRHWRRYLRAEGRSETTQRNYCLTLRHFASWLDAEDLPNTPAEITPGDITDWLLDVTDRTSGANAAFHYRNLKAFYRWLTSARERALRPGDSPMLEVPAPKYTEPVRATFDDGEVARLIATCNPSRKGHRKSRSGRRYLDVRDEAILRLFATTGMRLGGMSGLRCREGVEDLDNKGLNDLFLDRSQPLVRLRLKGGETHFYPIWPKAAVALDLYLRHRATRAHADSPHLWIGGHGGLGAQGIHYMIKRRAERAGIQRRIHAHMFRREVTKQLLDGDTDRAMIAQYMGWKDVRHVALYASESEQRRAWTAASKVPLEATG